MTATETESMPETEMHNEVNGKKNAQIVDCVCVCVCLITICRCFATINYLWNVAIRIVFFVVVCVPVI